MRFCHIALPLVALALVPACKQAESFDAEEQALNLAAANEVALADDRRVLELEGGRNFRDLGGYRTADGQRVKWGMVYRSGSPAGLTPADVEKLHEMGIRSFCDFRANDERATEPNPYVTAYDDVEYWSRDYDMQSGDMLAALFGDDATPEKTRAVMIENYRHMPEQQAEGFKAMFAMLADEKTPLAFNCSAGKDRTGVAAALLLTLLGVPREAVVADYALSDDILDFSKVSADYAEKYPQYKVLAQAPQELVAPLMATEPAYIEAALETLTEKYGSVDAFIEQELAVTPDAKAKIRANLLEPVPTA